MADIRKLLNGNNDKPEIEVGQHVLLSNGKKGNVISLNKKVDGLNYWGIKTEDGALDEFSDNDIEEWGNHLEKDYEKNNKNIRQLLKENVFRKKVDYDDPKKVIFITRIFMVDGREITIEEQTDLFIMGIDKKQKTVEGYIIVEDIDGVMNYFKEKNISSMISDDKQLT